MTDLERARAHLLHCQAVLMRYREMKAFIPALELGHFENAFLAALSWVWQCQEDEKCRQG